MIQELFFIYLSSLKVYRTLLLTYLSLSYLTSLSLFFSMNGNTLHEARGALTLASL